ncbi:MAG: imidazole glycerol phosphate synthase subunit HisH [Candidatus Omnitrophica bacterium]|nr:imidazole glycerol phosphate synthase subunit HisH [Candidatus Omnitrophota bacterium]
MIAIVDYGMGNLCSVNKAVALFRNDCLITDSPDKIGRASKIILPGVGHFGKSVKELKKRKLFTLIQEKIKEGTPFFGICVGMQLLFSESEEAPGVLGLAAIKGRVKRFNGRLAVPHMGWNQARKEGLAKKRQLFKGIKDKTFFYFAHSFYCQPDCSEVILTTTDYGVKFVSSLNQDNVWGIQFHPEKSQSEGLKVLNNFLNLC